MGMGSCGEVLTTPQAWNNGACDIMAVALHRRYHLPLMAEFEFGWVDGVETLGFLRHAWVLLPDGRGLDASGPHDHVINNTDLDPQDPWVAGGRVVFLDEDDPHLLDTRETDPIGYTLDIHQMGAHAFIDAHLAPFLATLGLVVPAPSSTPTPQVPT